jgi:hypothetical protein
MAAPREQTAVLQGGRAEHAAAELPRDAQPGYKVSFHTSRTCFSGTHAKVTLWQHVAMQGIVGEPRGGSFSCASAWVAFALTAWL